MSTKRLSQLSFILLTLIIIFSGGCAQLPDFAHPHVTTQPLDPSLEYVSYRQLRVEDFKAQNPSPGIMDHKHMINAHSSLSLRPASEIHYFISPPHNSFGLYKAYLQELSFKAVLFPTRSWWNPDLPPEKTTYVLQHEQIHFALMEIAARKLNKKLSLSFGQAITGTDKKTVERRLRAAVEKEIAASKNDILTEHTAFDEETSLYHDPKRQQQWYDYSQTTLHTLSQWAR